MAKVEMDMTEYEALKQVQTQLKDSLEQERVLRQELADAQELEVEALKANEKIVTVINETRSEEVVLVKGEPEFIIEQLEHTLMNLKSARFRGMHSMDYDSVSHFCDRLRDLFFTRQVLKQEPQQTVIRRGFDEVAEEVRQSVEKDLRESNAQRMAQIENELADAKNKATKYEQDAAKTSGLELDNIDLKARIEQYALDLKEATELKDIYENFYGWVKATKMFKGLFANRAKAYYDKIQGLIDDVSEKLNLREAIKNHKDGR